MGDGPQPYHADSKTSKQYVCKQRKHNVCVSKKVYLNENTGMMSQGAINHFSDYMHDYELEEIKKYSRVYYIPTVLPKQREKTDAMYIWEKRFLFFCIGDHIDYRYQITEMIGHYHRGYMLKATDCKTKQNVAVRVPLAGSEKLYQDIKMRIYIQSRDPDGLLSNCVQMRDYGHFRDVPFIILDHYEMNLKTFIAKHQPDGMDLETVSSIGRKILYSMNFLAYRNIIHGNIKPENIVMNTSTMEVKLTDFILSKFVDPQNAFDKECPDLPYRSPEVFCKGPQTTALDMWSFGCVVAEMVLGKVLLLGENEPDQFYLIQEVINTPPVEFFDYCYDIRQYFYRAFRIPIPIHVNDDGTVSHDHTGAAKTRKTPGKSPLSTHFIKGKHDDVKDFVRSALKWMPKQRISIARAMQHDLFEIRTD